MPKLRVHNFTLSVDGYAAGPDQSLDNPIGISGQRLHDGAFATRTFRQMFGMEAGEEGLDDSYAARGDIGIGATIMGRNMFGGGRGPWSTQEPWTGWWGPNPPYHTPTFVVTHHARAPLAMEGGTTFYFVTDGIESALKQAREAAGDLDIRIGGGGATANQYLAAGLVDEIELNIVPKIMGAGVPLFSGLAQDHPRLEPLRAVAGPEVTHVKYRVLH